MTGKKREITGYFAINGNGNLKNVSKRNVFSYYMDPGHLLGLLKIYFIRRFKFLKYNILRSKPRRCLEYRILPHFYSRKKFQNILLVGVSGCTVHYDEVFNNKEKVYSLDHDPGKAISGIRGRHIVDSIENLLLHFPKDSFDAVIVNGVYGWGLNKESTLRNSLKNIKEALKTNGVLVFGWDKTEKHDPIDLDAKDMFREYGEYKISGISKIELNDKHDHIYSFYQKM